MRRLADLLLLSLWYACFASAQTGQPPLELGKLEVPPKATWIPRVLYPEHLIYNGQNLQGVVRLRLSLDAAGLLTGSQVLFATHPAFIPPAMRAIADGKFTPGYNKGKAVASALVYEVGFQIKQAGINVGVLPVMIPARLPDLPPEYNYDLPPWALAITEVVYSRKLQLEGVTGEARVRYVIDEQGRVAGGEVVSASRPEFGAALLAAVETWRFMAASKSGRPTKSMVAQEEKFKSSGWRPSEEQRVLKELRKGGKALVEIGALDEPLHPLYQVAPQYPRALEKERVNGEAEIEFIVTRTGQAVLPEVISASRPEFGWAAMNAINQWYYQIPKVKNRAVDVRVRIPIGFVPTGNAP